MTNTKLLRDKIKESGYKLYYIAERLNISYQCLLNKMNNKTEMKAAEISVLCQILKISKKEKEAIFFWNPCR